MYLDFENLQTVIQDAARSAFTKLHETYPSEQFYGFSLYTDDNVTSIYAAANSEEGYQQAVINLQDAFEEIGPADLQSLRWATVEWEYDLFGKEYFKDLVNLLDSANHNNPENSVVKFELHREQVLKAMIAALHELDREDLFGTGEDREKITIFASISDSDSDEGFQSENDSAKILNPESVFQSFKTRYE